MKLKNTFPSYVPISDDQLVEWWNSALFTFDTNVLLDFYGLKQSSREEVLQLLEELKMRIWIPHQVGFEFMKNREKVINQQSNKYKAVIDRLGRVAPTIRKSIEEAQQALESESQEAVKEVAATLASNFANLLNETDASTSRLEASANEIIDQLSKARASQQKLIQIDPILDRLADIFGENIGDPYSDAEKEEIFKLGEERYNADPPIPPGYKDAKDKKGDDIYGDLLVWMQILDKASKVESPIVLIQNEQKEDWVEKRTESKRPRRELIEEMHQKTGKQFYILTFSEFLDRAQRYLNFSLSPAVIPDVSRLEEEFELVLVHPSHSRNKTRFEVDDAAVAEALDEYITNNIPDELESLASLVRIENVWVTNIDDVIINKEGIQIKGYGDIDVELQYGGTRDHVTGNSSFPFYFEGVFSHELVIEELYELNVDVSSFYE